ncbi:MAG TPA: alpha/beta hydrolase [Polyangiales bacterium]|jgi:pimeloyl-ACP methyl ester carboxylesterase|nr:alpha/beta hydrolase [Polyangiales bacterium]
MKVLHWERKRAPAGDGTWVEYEVLGRGMPVLLANGLAGPREVWTDLVRQQHDRYRFITWNYRGLQQAESNGGSHSARSIAEHARDAGAVLDAEEISRCCVVGWSMGVQTALELFSLAPNRVSSLILLSGAARVTWAEVPTAPALGRFVLRTLRLLRSAPRLVSDTLRRSLQSPEAYTWARRLGLIGEQVTADEFTTLTSGLAQMNVAVYADTLAQLSRYDARDVLPRVDVPTLVIAGDRDLFTSRREVERLVSEIRGAEYLPLPGATHYALLDEAERVNLRIEKFWNEHGYRAAAAPSA